MCANGLKARMEEADAAGSRGTRDTAAPAAIDYTVDRAPKLLAENQRADKDAPKRLQTEIKCARQQLERLLDAVADRKAPAAVLSKMQALEASVAEKERELGDVADRSTGRA